MRGSSAGSSSFLSASLQRLPATYRQSNPLFLSDTFLLRFVSQACYPYLQRNYVMSSNSALEYWYRSQLSIGCKTKMIIKLFTSKHYVIESQIQFLKMVGTEQENCIEYENRPSLKSFALASMTSKICRCFHAYLKCRAGRKNSVRGPHAARGPGFGPA